MSGEQRYVGVDIGGSSVKAGVVTESGQVLTRSTTAMEFEHGRDAMLERLYGLIEEIIAESGSESDVGGIGLAAPGTMDIPGGIIFHPFNLPGWENLPLRDLVAERFGLPAILQNDANAAAFGEYWLGAAREADSLMFWTLGTGVGGGIVLNGRVWEGAHSHAGECGHMIIQQEGGLPSEFGIHGSLELYAGARGLVRRCLEALESSPDSLLKSRQNEGQTITPLVIAEAAKAGDTLADELIMETARYLAVGTVNVMHILNPAMVLIGGAMTFDQNESELGRRFLQRLKDEVHERAFPILAERTVIDYATLGGDAGFIGAAGCARAARL
ncbi:Glucokinase [Maioricimonas rarisocia]|uniref:Glucokinase n=1 Tax=Maioricimonas rarisocia TaxID=2528026 RepID=A0A517Z6Z2_9PLAN|nr:ROK family protein [Maioricimonas rarisocia]QDU38250.1 Glucokinase [Maioricimonas rarisocia]